MNRKNATSVYLRDDQKKKLKKLCDRTGIPAAVLIRDSIDKGLPLVLKARGVKK